MVFEVSEIVIFNRSCFDLSFDFLSQFDCMITDPPYSEHVHSNATSQSKGRGTRKRDLGFVSLTRKGRTFVAEAASRVKRWSLVYSDWESFNFLAIAAQARGTEYVRVMPWVRWSMPQLSGDRPPQGSEALVVMHRASLNGKRVHPIKKHWNGPGSLTHLDELCMRGEGKHKTQKKLSQALRLVSYFSDVGETVFDPFGGSGTTAQACRILERNCVSFELDEQWAAHAQARTSEALNPSDTQEVAQWLARDDEPKAQQEEGPSVIRANNRANDRALAKRWV